MHMCEMSACTQVGELPPQRIPVALKVEGSPLVISKQRVQVQGSEVLHTLLHQQQRPLLLPSRQPLRLPVAAACCGGSADASGDASHGKGSDNNNHSQLSGAATGSSGATGSVEGSIASTQRSVRTDVRLDFGVVPAGVEVQHTLFVSNTGEGLPGNSATA
jgi:hypothetical protein